MAAWVMFVPMLACDALALIREQEVFAWWGLLCTALAQLALLPPGMNLGTARSGFPGQSEAEASDHLRLRMFSG
jgi:hypothetical protein